MSNLESALSKVDSAVTEYFVRNQPFKSVRSKFGTKLIPLCPICGAECEHEEDFMEHIKMEEHVTCPNHHYAYSFVTGSVETNVGSVVVHGYYADSEEEKKHQSRIISLAIIHAREEWRKKHEYEVDSGRKG